jgi:ABC-type glycerol-3-phosphate transport system substrate-binding protein
MNRRDFVRMMAAGAAAAPGVALPAYAGRRRAAAPPTPTPSPTVTQYIGNGSLNLVMWVQNYGPSVDASVLGAQAFVKKNPDARVQMEITPYETLQEKAISAAAAGTEADIFTVYNAWLLSVPISELYLNVTPYMGGVGGLEKVVFPGALKALPPSGNQYYMVPTGCGMNAVAVTVNTDAYKEKGIDYTTISTFEDLVTAGKELTTTSGGTMTRAGLAVTGYEAFLLMQTFIQQQGGSFYDNDNGKWNFATNDGKAAAQKLYDLWWTDKVTSWDLINDTNEDEQFVRGLEVSDFIGAYHGGSDEATNPNLHTAAFAVPPLKGAKNDILQTDQEGGWALSRQLASDKPKRTAAIALLHELLTTSLYAQPETYSGAIAVKAVYEQKDLASMKYGERSKAISEALWPRVKFQQGHVATVTPAQTELESYLRKEQSLSDSLSAIDTYMNQQEKLARQRLGLKS